jgi:hypothetical protein
VTILTETNDTETIVVGWLVSVEKSREYLYGIFPDYQSAVNYANQMDFDYPIKIRQVLAPTLH